MKIGSELLIALCGFGCAAFRQPLLGLLLTLLAVLVSEHAVQRIRTRHIIEVLTMVTNGKVVEEPELAAKPKVRMRGVRIEA